MPRLDVLLQTIRRRDDIIPQESLASFLGQTVIAAYRFDKGEQLPLLCQQLAWRMHLEQVDEIIPIDLSDAIRRVFLDGSAIQGKDARCAPARATDIPIEQGGAAEGKRLERCFSEKCCAAARPAILYLPRQTDSKKIQEEYADIVRCGCCQPARKRQQAVVHPQIAVDWPQRNIAR